MRRAPPSEVRRCGWLRRRGPRGPDVDRPRAVELFDRHGLGSCCDLDAEVRPRGVEAAEFGCRLVDKRADGFGSSVENDGRRIQLTRKVAQRRGVHIAEGEAVSLRRAGVLPPRRSRSRIPVPLRVPPVPHAADEGVEERRTEPERGLGALVDFLPQRLDIDARFRHLHRLAIQSSQSSGVASGWNWMPQASAPSTRKA